MIKKLSLPFVLGMIFLMSCNETIENIEETKDVVPKEENLRDTLTSIDFNNILSISQSQLHGRIVEIWSTESDSIRTDALKNLKFELPIHSKKISELDLKRPLAKEFKESVLNYVQFLDSNYSQVEMISDGKCDTDCIDRFNQSYNQLMDSISKRQERFAIKNKVTLQ